ncbi:MAG: hypothetical protein ACYCPS_03335 [Candidatus Saccharimonadales bacterium]
MNRETLLEPHEATAKLFSQYERDPETIDLLVNEGMALEDAVCLVTQWVATSFCEGLSPGKELNYLSSWNKSVRTDCSIKFFILLEDDPTLRREDVKNDKNLQILNGIRRGVHRAMKRTQNSLHA